ncbi:MAG: hypothetical protein E6F99_22220 [Actinobacteria bacterium]|nr:MAG: hypothetical protein E6F99_22220 [Actinomycetota bacterium]
MNARSVADQSTRFRATRNRYRRSVVLPSATPADLAPVPDHNLYAIVLVDVAGSASTTAQGRARMRRDLYDLMDGALDRRGLDLATFALNDTGDGLRLFVPFHRVRPTDIVDMFVLGFLAGLRQQRQYATEAARIRLRMAIDLGLVGPHLQGWIGDPLVRVARLVDAEPLRDVLRNDPGLDLAVVVSDEMYLSVVRPGDGYVPSEGFQPVVVRVKEFAARAWLLRPHAYWLCGSCTAAAA